jgi:serine/threonine-protein kinase
VLLVFELVEVVAQACEALVATHAAGIVHRDVKPENLFLVAGPNPFVKLLDFGVAKPLDDDDCLEVDRLPAGTPQYMSPEHMFDPAKTDARSDLFSLAAVAYYALTRRSPFDTDTLESLLFAIDGAAFERPSELRPELPAAIDGWFEKALARDPEDRFASAREMATALYDAVRHSASERPTLVPHAAHAEPAPTLGGVRGLPRRGGRPRIVFVAGFLLAAAASVLVFGSGADVPSAAAKTAGVPPSSTSQAASGCPPEALAVP